MVKDIFVDEAIIPFRGQNYCHLWCPDTNYLIEFSRKLKIHPKQLQTKTKRFLHFKLSPDKRELAIELGAKELTALEMVNMVRVHNEQKALSANGSENL